MKRWWVAYDSNLEDIDTYYGTEDCAEMYFKGTYSDYRGMYEDRS